MAFNGPKKKYIYYLDDGKTWTVLTRDQSNSEILGVAGAGAAEEYNAASPPTGTGVSRMNFVTRFTPRYAYWESNDGTQKRRLTIFEPESDLYATSPVARTVDGVAGSVVSRVGEKITF